MSINFVSLNHGCTEHRVLYLQGIEDSKEPCKDCSVLVDSKQSKHPRQSQQWEQDHRCLHQSPTMSVEHKAFVCTHTMAVSAPSLHRESTDSLI